MPRVKSSNPSSSCSFYCDPVDTKEQTGIGDRKAARHGDDITCNGDIGQESGLLTETKRIYDLPVEMLLEILSYLDVEDILNAVQDVCVRWKEASRHLKLWRELVYRPEEYDNDDKIIHILQKAPMLRTLIFDKVKVGSEVLETLAVYCVEIRKLDLSRNEFNYAFLENLLFKCPKIEHLVIQNRCLSSVTKPKIVGQRCCLKTLIVTDEDDSTISLQPIADGCPSLEHLDISGTSFLLSDLEYLLHLKNTKLHTLGVTCVSEEEEHINLSGCEALQNLNLDCTCPFEVKPELQSLGSLKSLTNLTLSSLKRTDIRIVKCLFDERNMAQLKELTITDYYSYQDELASVIAFNCPRLKKLHLTSCSNLSDDSLKNLNNLLELRSVDFYDSDITDIGIAYLTKCKHLNYLGLGCCRKLKAEGMKLMMAFTNLQELVLYGCDITGLPFYQIPAKLKHLSCLQVSFENEYQYAENQLKKLMPRLTVKHPTSLRAYLYRNFNE